MLSGVKRLLCLHRIVKPLCVVLVLLVWGSAAGQEPRAKDLTVVYGRYEIYEAIEYGASVETTAADAQAWIGQEMVVTADLYHAFGARIENPTYTVWFYPDPPMEGVVPPYSERWSSDYLSGGEWPGGDEIIKVYRPGPNGPIGPWTYLEVIGTNELWKAFDGWYYKTRKTDRPVLPPGHDDYCQVMGPCSAGQGDCDSDSECQSGLTCMEAVGADYGLAADSNVCLAASPGDKD